MRRVVLALLLLIATSVAASDETQRLLDAPRVRDVLTVYVDSDKDKPVKYRVDDSFDGTLQDNDTFAAPRTIVLTYKNFNPFKFTVGATATTAPDPNQKDIGTFFDVLLGLAKGVVPNTTAAGAGPSANRPGERPRVASDLPEKIRRLQKAASECDRGATRLART